MNQTSERIIFEAFTLSDLSAPERARSSVRYILAAPEAFRPSSMGLHDPPEVPISKESVERAVELLRQSKSTDTASVGHLYLGADEPSRVLYYLQWYRGSKPNFNKVKAEFPVSLASDQRAVRTLLAFTSGLFDLVDGVYGFIAHSDEWRAGHIVRKVLEPGVVEERFVKFSPGTPLTGVYWANHFGPPYVDRFGKDSLKRVACHSKETTARGTVLLLTAPTPLDHAKSDVRRMKETIVRELGQDAFKDATIA